MAETLSAEAWRKSQAAKRKALGTSQATSVITDATKLRRSHEAHARWEYLRAKAGKRQALKGHAITVALLLMAGAGISLARLPTDQTIAASAAAVLLAAYRTWRLARSKAARSRTERLQMGIIFGMAGVPLLYLASCVAVYLIWPSGLSAVATFGLILTVASILVSQSLHRAEFTVQRPVSEIERLDRGGRNLKIHMAHKKNEDERAYCRRMRKINKRYLRI
jgi:hypothetical protein